MSAKPRDLGMTPLDDLFSTDESRAEAQLEKVVTLNPADISDFPNHPFKVKQDEAMAEMVDSVKQYGVLVPALVRPKADGGYEMVAGHRRKCAATLAGITEMPCIIELEWNGEAYTATLTDTNGVLSDYVFSASTSGIRFSVSGNTLTITADDAPSDTVTITAEKRNSQRRGVITWTDGVYGPNGKLQDTVTYSPWPLCHNR